MSLIFLRHLPVICIAAEQEFEWKKEKEGDEISCPGVLSGRRFLGRISSSDREVPGGTGNLAGVLAWGAE